MVKLVRRQNEKMMKPGEAVTISVNPSHWQRLLTPPLPVHVLPVA